MVSALDAEEDTRVVLERQKEAVTGLHVCDQGFPPLCACVRCDLQRSDDSVGPVSVPNVQHLKPTLICVVFHFELQVTRVRLHRQHATLQVLLFAIVGVFKGDVSLEKGGKRGCVYDQAVLKPTQGLNVRTPIR